MSVQIAYQVSYKEYRRAKLQLSRLAHSKTKRATKSIVLFAVVIALGFATFQKIWSDESAAMNVSLGVESNPTQSWERTITMGFWFAIFCVIWVATFRILRLTTRHRFDSDLQNQSIQQVLFDDGGMTMQNVLGVCHRPWELFVRFEESADFLFLFTTAIEAQTIPKRAFPSPPILDEVRRLAMNRIKPVLAKSTEISLA